MTPEELEEMKQGGVPYSQEENQRIEQKQFSTTPSIFHQEVGGNGFKYFRKCPTCGQMQEVTTPAIIQPFHQQKEQQSLQQFMPSPSMNPYIRPFPQEVKQPPAPDRIASEEKDEAGNPLVDARWNDVGTGRIPNTPIQ